MLSAADLKAINEALVTFKALELAGHEVSKETFPLPNDLSERLSSAAYEVHRGRGLCQIQGLDPTLYSEADNLLVFLAIANYIGDKRGIQDKKGNVITHITDAKAWTVPYEKRHVVHTNQHLTWHCDMGADVLALQVRQVAARGGATMVASSWKIYNIVASERPDVIRVLAEPNWPVHVSNRKSRHVLASLLEFHDGKLLMNFDPSRLGTHPAMKPRRSRPVAIPSLTEAQQEALRVVAAVAERNSLQLGTKAGDILFINNWALLHARSAYTDSGEEAEGQGTVNQRRHLLRLWIRNSQLGWKIPENLRAPWEAAFSYADEGYVSGDHQNGAVTQLRYPVMPEPDYKPARYTTGSAAFVIEDSESEYDDE
ncbi:taurine catabolism dioxygenase family protein [Grosmannia clavigera kw1407]|uniref:Taurine catabolism dioxygenase family protein n=1 Tax=Grosmannia clavigera (strain kw1407 / UAMH 11150) TaxID=655863 RepID=F0XP33_GROCL|nr:taurine catabolism dioxygenase family protein [Grosmannia clavigera kw1407]EFX00167.1 taurine catabolism dioxygenase family protein [Grosmannia clavigera kw1407]